MEKKSIPYLIFDTDMDTDCDDAGALAMLLHYAKRGQVKLLGIVADTPDRHAAPACEALCRAFDADVPIGALRVADYPAGEGTRFDRYRTHRLTLTEDRCYTHALSATVGKSDCDYEGAVSLYRRLLQDAPDHSVTVVCVGLLTALDALLLSGPDEISPLSGVQLVERKVDRLVSMTNAVFPEVVNKNFNYDMDPGASARVCAAWPRPIWASPDGSDVITGKGFSAALPQGHPLRVAYEMYNCGAGRGRSSWDPIALYAVLEPDCGLYTATPRGNLAYEEEERRTFWLGDGKRGDIELRVNIPAEQMAEVIEAAMLGNCHR